MHYGDITDSTSVSKIIKAVKPNEIYNLAAQSHVAVSFEVPEYTANADALGALRILEAIKFHKMEKKTKFYQAGTSEMFGKFNQFHKKKLLSTKSLWCCKLYVTGLQNYREAYNIFVINGILFNHESPRRGETFVTKKLLKLRMKIKEGTQSNCLLEIKCERLGTRKDYVEAMWKILQQKLQMIM